MKYQLNILSNSESLSIIRNWVSSCTKTAGFDNCFKHTLILAVDEACSNIVQHAYPNNNDGPIEICCHTSHSAAIVVIRDFGKYFQPDDYQEPNLAKSLNSRKAGGYGIKLINLLVDEVEYRRRNQKNELRLVKFYRKEIV